MKNTSEVLLILRWNHCRNMHKYCSTLPLDSNSSPNPFFFLIVNANEARSTWKTSARYILSCPFWKTFPFTHSKIVEAQKTDGSSSRGRCINLVSVPKSKTWPLVCSKSLCCLASILHLLKLIRLLQDTGSFKQNKGSGRSWKAPDTLHKVLLHTRPTSSSRDCGNLSKTQSF